MRNVRVFIVLLGQEVSAQVVNVADDVTYTGVLETVGITLDPETMSLQETNNDKLHDLFAVDNPDSGCPDSDSTLVVFEKAMFEPIPDEGEESAPDPESVPGEGEEPEKKE